jgi:hypothetical protein
MLPVLSMRSGLGLPGLDVLRQRFRFAVDKVIHHDDVIFAVIVWTRDSVSLRDPHAGDPSIIEFHAEERETSVAGAGGNITTEQSSRTIDRRIRPATNVTSK